MSQLMTRDPGSGRSLENLSLTLALGAGGLGFGLGLLLFDDTTPLLGGERSIGEVSALTAAAAAGVAFLVVVLRFRRQLLPWYRRVSRVRRVLDLVGLTLMQATLTFFLATALFAVFQGAFRQLELDVWAGSFLAALACAIAAYVGAGSASSLSTESLAVLVAAFLVIGALGSALNAADELWWQAHFSALGAAADRSGIAFNYTLVLTGLVLVTLADFLTHDLSRWSVAMGQPHWKVTVVRIGLAVMGGMLGMVGVIPVNRSLFWHNFVTYVAIGAFAVLLVGIPLLFPRLPGGFHVVSALIAALLVLAVVLHFVVAYLNITAFEIVAVSTVFVWLVLFIRTVVAALRDVEPLRARS